MASIPGQPGLQSKTLTPKAKKGRKKLILYVFVVVSKSVPRPFICK